MSRDYDRQQWQAEQAARDAAVEKQREKERKARERSARNARRKLERLQRTLSESGDISDFEAEFAESVGERLDEFGSAFRDLEKGRPGDALSFAQKRVVAGMNRKAKELRKSPRPSADNEAETPRRRYSSFKSKKHSYTPRIRQLDEDFEDAPPSDSSVEEEAITPERPPVGKPFLRVVGRN